MKKLKYPNYHLIKNNLNNVFKYFLICFLFIIYPVISNCQTKLKNSSTNDFSVESNNFNSKKLPVYIDTIYLGLFKTALVEIKGIHLKGVNIGSQADEIVIGQQDSTSIILIKARKRGFKETVLNIFGEDTTMQFLVRYEENPQKTLFTYTLPGYNSNYTRGGENGNYRQFIIDELLAAQNKHIEDSLKGKTQLERNEKALMNPKNKLFAGIRSKNQNINVGAIDKGVRIYLQKIYKSGNLTYLMVRISNYSMSQFQLNSFRITKGEGQGATDIKLINEETAYNTLKRFEKVDFVIISDNLELMSTEKLVFEFTSNKEKALKFEVVSKNFEKREAL